MNAILGQLAIAAGGVLFIVTLIITLSDGMPIMTAIFRGLIVMCITSVIMAFFFKFLSSVLYNFVVEQVKKYNRTKAKGAAAGKKPGKPSRNAENNV